MGTDLDIKNVKSDIGQEIDFSVDIERRMRLLLSIKDERVWSPERLPQAEMLLLAACSLHEIGAHREAFVTAIHASQELFAAIGTHASSQEPLRHLFEALLELDKGRTDGALERTRFANRGGEPGSEWNARAALCLALQARMDIGEREVEAAEALRKKTAIVPGAGPAERELPVRRLIEWRKQFRSRTKQPPAGMVVWAAGLERIAAILDRPLSIDREEHLAEFERGMIKAATTLRSRISPSPKARG